MTNQTTKATIQTKTSPSEPRYKFSIHARNGIVQMRVVTPNGDTRVIAVTRQEWDAALRQLTETRDAASTTAD